MQICETCQSRPHARSRRALASVGSVSSRTSQALTRVRTFETTRGVWGRDLLFACVDAFVSLGSSVKAASFHHSARVPERLNVSLGCKSVQPVRK